MTIDWPLLAALNKEKRELENQKLGERRKEKGRELFDEEKHLVRQQNRICRQKSRENQKHELAHQKLQGLLQKGRKRIRNEDGMRKS